MENVAAAEEQCSTAPCACSTATSMPHRCHAHTHVRTNHGSPPKNTFLRYSGESSRLMCVMEPPLPSSMYGKTQAIPNAMNPCNSRARGVAVPRECPGLVCSCQLVHSTKTSNSLLRPRKKVDPQQIRFMSSGTTRGWVSPLGLHWHCLSTMRIPYQARGSAVDVLSCLAGQSEWNAGASWGKLGPQMKSRIPTPISLTIRIALSSESRSGSPPRASRARRPSDCPLLPFFAMAWSCGRQSQTQSVCACVCVCTPNSFPSWPASVNAPAWSGSRIYCKVRVYRSRQMLDFPKAVASFHSLWPTSKTLYWYLGHHNI